MVLNARRVSIAAVLALGYGYYHLSGGSAALAAIGLIAFVGVAQFLPAMMGGIFWRGATKVGAAVGLATGFVIWAYALFLPSFGPDAVYSAQFLAEGPMAIGWLRPQALFGVEAMDPLTHALFWSLMLNGTAFFIGSVLTFPGPVERLQGAAFVNVFDDQVGPRRWSQGQAEPEQLLVMAQRILGEDEAQSLFETAARRQGKSDTLLPDPTPEFLFDLEQRLSGQKDAFLSQISHELRTPMTSIRAFSEILTEGDLPPGMVTKSGRVIQDEAKRLTRLLDDLLDLSVLENGKVSLSLSLANLREMIDRAIQAAEQVKPERSFTFHRDLAAENIFIRTDADRLTQVFINLVSNARKYCEAPHPEIRVTVRIKGGRVIVDVADNGKGIPKDAQSTIFEKFTRLPGESRAKGAGLGLAICREIVVNLGGTIGYLPGQGGAALRVTLPLQGRSV